MLSPQRAKRKDSLLQEAQTRRAVIALLTHVEKERAGNAALFEDADIFSLIISLKRMSGEKKTKPKRIPLPHPFFQTEGKEVCLFVKDHDGEGHKTAKAKIKATEDSGVAKVIGVSKLKSNYKAPESRRRLCSSFDLFCADDRILPLLPKLIGKTFFKKKKQPVPVDLTKQDWAAEIRKATSATYLFLQGGTSLNVRVGISDQTEAELTANVLAAAAGAAELVPRGWDNIQSLFLKTTASVALPIYTASITLPAKIEGALAVPKGITEGDGEGDAAPASKAAKRARGDTPGGGKGAPRAASARNRPMLEQALAPAGAAGVAGAKATGGRRVDKPAVAGGASARKAAVKAASPPPARAAAKVAVKAAAPAAKALESAPPAAKVAAKAAVAKPAKGAAAASAGGAAGVGTKKSPGGAGALAAPLVAAAKKPAKAASGGKKAASAAAAASPPPTATTVGKKRKA